MIETLVKRIREGKDSPIIGVIGGTAPTEEYSRSQGLAVGYALRELVEELGGSIFTGGVDGVGVDVYAGIVKRSIELKSTNDHFFALVPEFDEGRLTQGAFTLGSLGLKKGKSYNVPETYTVLSSLLSKDAVSLARAGKDMTERRKYVAEVADFLVMVNGGLGTLDEAFRALEKPIPVISLTNSGGTALLLSEIKQREIPPKLNQTLEKQGISAKRINKDYILPVSDIESMIRQLRSYSP